eukprot:UN07890
MPIIPYTPDENDIVEPSENYYDEVQYDEEFDGDIETITPNPDIIDIHIEMQSKTKSIGKQSKQSEPVGVTTITQIKSYSEDEDGGDTNTDKG